MSGTLSPSSRLVNCRFDRSLLLHPASPVHPAEQHSVSTVFHFTPVLWLHTSQLSALFPPAPSAGPDFNLAQIVTDIIGFLGF